MEFEVAEDIKAAIHRKLEQQRDVSLSEPLTKSSLLRLGKPVLLEQEIFAATERTLDSLKATNARCSVWEASERYNVLQRRRSRLSKELCDTSSSSAPRGIFEIQNLTIDVSDEALLDGFDIFDEGALLSLGSTFTPYHVEDYCLQNLATLQRVHKHASDACKIWFITTDPIKGQNLRRAQYHNLCLEMIEGADYVIVQQEGQTIYVPPLAYHAVLTVYSENVKCEGRYTLLCGTFFADVREGSLWRDCISLWMRNHQTGHRHGSTKSLLRKYVKYVEDPVRAKRLSKRQKRKERASFAVRKRWKSESS